MDILGHVVLFVVAIAVLWVSAGHLIETVERLARRTRQSSFTVAFFVLGFLTSISELSVMVNSTIKGEPNVSAGNLAGASIVLILFLVPTAAVLANGIELERMLNRTHLALALIAAALPAFLLLDGDADRVEGVACLLLYGSLLFLIRRQSASVEEDVEELIEEVIEEYEKNEDSTLIDVLKVVVGAALLVGAGNLLVEETVYLSDQLEVPASVIGLVLLSFGTNVPEVTVAARSAQKGRMHVAFGNYVGSSVSNTFLFGLLLTINGGFTVEASEFVITAALMAIGFAAFFAFAWSQNRISRIEGVTLLAVYAAFVALQIALQALDKAQ